MNPAKSSFNDCFYSHKPLVDQVFNGFRKSPARGYKKEGVEPSSYSQSEESARSYVTVIVKVNGCYHYKKLYSSPKAELS